MQHLLLTPFNVRIADWGCRGSRGLEPAWLAHRLELFEAFCAPSVRAQTTRDFQWLIFVDPETPSEALDTIGSAAAPAIASELVPVENASMIDAAIVDRYECRTLTTKLDNDDALSRSHLQTVQQAITDGAESVLFTTGVVLFIDSGRAYRLHHRYSPFYSLVSDPRDVTALSIAQGAVQQGFPPCRELQNGFLRVIHENNSFGTSGGIGRRIPLRQVNVDFAVGDILCGDSIPRYSLDLLKSGVREAVVLSRRWAARKVNCPPPSS